MVHLRGRGESAELFKRVRHHAEGIGHLLAPLAVVVYGTLARGEERHEMHIGVGWNSVNITLANGQKVALRARGRPYREVTVHVGSFTPLGRQVMSIRDEQGAWRFERWLAKRAT